MKPTPILIAAALLFALPGAGALAQHPHHVTEAPAKSSPAAHRAVGTVKNIDLAKGTALIDHEPVKSLNWPRMTMVFQVRDKSLGEKLAAGRKAEFEFTQQGSDYVITAVK